jgi:hypothetical protein
VLFIKRSIFWDITLCSLSEVIGRFGGCACYLLHAGFLLGLFFVPEDVGDMFLQNVV